MCILYILYIYIHIYVYKSFSTILDKGLRKNNNKKRDRETRKHKLNEMGALTMNRKSKTNWIKVKDYHIVQLFLNMAALKNHI